jgi:hypothetical protein
VQQDKQHRLDDFKKEQKKMDEDEIEDFWLNLEKMDKVWGYTMDVTSVLMRNMPEQICGEVLEKVWPHYAKMMNDIDHRKDYELIEGTCFLVDCIELGSDEMIAALTHSAQPTVPGKFFEILTAKGDTSPVLC